MDLEVNNRVAVSLISIDRRGTCDLFDKGPSNEKNQLFV
jgi:hypothetical protein